MGRKPQDDINRLDTNSMRVGNDNYIPTTTTSFGSAFIGVVDNPNFQLASSPIGAGRYIFVLKFNSTNFDTFAPETEVSYRMFNADGSATPIVSEEYTYNDWLGDVKVQDLSNGNIAIITSPLTSFLLNIGANLSTTEKSTHILVIDNNNFLPIKSTKILNASQPFGVNSEHSASDIIADPNGGFGVAWRQLTYSPVSIPALGIKKVYLKTYTLRDLMTMDKKKGKH